MRLFSKKLLAVLVFSILINEIFSRGLVEAKPKIKLNKTKITLKIGQKKKLKLKNCKKKVKWSSSKKKVAVVNKKGVVTAKRKGKAKITAKVGKKKYVCKVTVKKNSAVKISPTASAKQAENHNTIRPNESPLITPEIKVSPTPGTSSEPEFSSTPDVTPGIEVSPTPGTSSEPEASSTPDALIEDAPRFLCFKTYEGQEIQTEEPQFMPFHSLSNKKEIFTGVETLSETLTEKRGNNWINQEDMLLLRLSYENKKRDSIVEIVLNDSDYGKRQIYTTAASINKILSSDTYYDKEKDCYLTDVVLQMPKTKKNAERRIEIVETSFLRETIGLKGYADLSLARQTSVDFLVSEEPLPSYSVYFNFLENEEQGYTLVSLSSQFDLPDTLYIPPEYKGKPVSKIAEKAFDKASIKKLVIPESIQEISMMVSDTALGLSLTEMEMKGKTPLLAYSGSGILAQCKIIVPEQYAYQYSVAPRWDNYSIGFQTETGEYSENISLPDVPLPETPKKFPEVTIDERNEDPRTLYSTNLYYKDILWEKDPDCVSFQAQSYDEWMSNGGVCLYLDAEGRKAVDVSEYQYIKLDVETDAEIMVKLYAKEGSIFNNIEERFEGRFQPGRRTVNINISNCERNILSLMVNANKRDANIKIFGIEFVKEKPEEISST